MRKIIADKVLMVAPRTFCSNPETEGSNAFQVSDPNLSASEILQKAQSESAKFKELLQSHGIQVEYFIEDENQKTPDALFPNNWFCTLPDGTLILFPMYAENRRREVRDDIISSVDFKNILDLRLLTKEQKFLEGTGSLILDHDNKIAYACYSVRTHFEALQKFSEETGYQVHSFRAVDSDARPIYHTNVMMSLGSKTAIVVLSSIADQKEKAALVKILEATQKNIVDISFEQMKNFAGNMLYLKNTRNENFWVCSSRAFESLNDIQKKILQDDGKILHSALDTIETHGGGGARCLLAELY